MKTAVLKPAALMLLVYIAGALVTMGTLGDRIGRRRLLMWGAAAFGASPWPSSLSLMIIS